MDTMYARMAEKLGGRQSRKVDHNTYLQRRDQDTIALLYHQTDIVKYHQDGHVVIDTAGWHTSTTKKRLNDSYSGLAGFQFYANKGLWWVNTPEFLEPHQRRFYCNTCRKGFTQPIELSATTGNLSGERMPDCPKCGLIVDYASPYLKQSLPFADGLTLRPNGNGKYHVDMSTIGEDPKAQQKLHRRIKRFARDYITAFQAGQVPPPSNGDCMYCNAGMQTAEGLTLAESSRDSGHITSHIEEKYYVPSLLYRAMKTFPCSQAMLWAVGSVWNPMTDHTHGPKQLFERISGGLPDFVWDQLTKILAKYIIRLVDGRQTAIRDCDKG